MSAESDSFLEQAADFVLELAAEESKPTNLQRHAFITFLRGEKKRIVKRGLEIDPDFEAKLRKLVPERQQQAKQSADEKAAKDKERLKREMAELDANIGSVMKHKTSVATSW